MQLRPDDCWIAMPMFEVSATQHRCLVLSGRGYTDSEIASEINYSTKTVHLVMSLLMGELKARSRPHLIVLALRVGIVTLGDFE
jgi:DNA-binding NarL/FixJ family response regulator